jgi:hypothetical protein
MARNDSTHIDNIAVIPGGAPASWRGNPESALECATAKS